MKRLSKLEPVMRRLSARWGRFTRRLEIASVIGIALAWQGVAVVAVISLLSHGRPLWECLIALPIALPFAGFVMWMRKEMAKVRFVDEVWDAGECLLLRHQGDEAWIPYSDIAELDYADRNPASMTLTLSRACCFGQELTFSLPQRLIGFGCGRVVKHLIARTGIEKIYPTPDGRRPRRDGLGQARCLGEVVWLGVMLMAMLLLFSFDWVLVTVAIVLVAFSVTGIILKWGPVVACGVAGILPLLVEMGHVSLAAQLGLMALGALCGVMLGVVVEAIQSLLVNTGALTVVAKTPPVSSSQLA